MFVSTRRKTASERRSATILRSTTDPAHELFHWAWTGWMPEAEKALSQPGGQSTEHHASLLAA